MSESICEVCGVKFEHRDDKDRMYCSNDCKYESYKKDRPVFECEYCGDEFERSPSREESEACKYCNHSCKQKDKTGEENPNWNGGAVNYYGSNWRRVRRKVLERDDYECVICGKGKDELGREPDVHHIIPIKEFDEKEDANYTENLMTVCRKHHTMIEGVF